MSYTPTNWATGDVITAEKLNKLEQGVASAGGALVLTDTNGTLDKTWQEIHDADFAVVKSVDDVDTYTWFVMDTYADDGDYGAIVGPKQGATIWTEYIADSASGYPVASGSGGGGQ
jgi:hypothetical protein